MADVERLVRQHRRLQMVGMLTYAVWCGALVLRMSPWFTPGTYHLLSLLEVIFMLPWGVCLVMILNWQRQVKAQPHVFATINDEMALRIRWRAQLASRTVVLVSLVAGVVITSFVTLSAPLVLMMLIWILVISQLGFYLWFDRGE